MKFLSVCAGIEAASVAWHSLGWRCAGVSEIEAFPRAVLEQRQGAVAVDFESYTYTEGSNITPLFGDFTKIEEHHVGPIDILVGGTPCQSFSIAGLRGGLADNRGNLALEFLRLAQRTWPKWLVWENVPGVLSSNGGRDFGAIIAGMVECGYGIAYRVLDAQYFGVPQRRRRVFVVGHLGDWRRAAAVLFERESLHGNPAPRREKGQETSGRVTARTFRSVGVQDAAEGHLIKWPADTAPTLNASFGDKHGLEDQHIRGGQDGSFPQIAMCLNAGAMGRRDAETETLIPTHGGEFDEAETTHTLRGEGFNAREDGTGRGTPLVVCAIQERAVSENPDTGPDGKGWRDDGLCYTLEARQSVQAVAFDTTQVTSPSNYSSPNFGDPCHPLTAGMHAPAVAFSAKDYGADAIEDCCPTLRAGGHASSHANGGVMPAVSSGNAVRRLTPRECERLQGFPDDYTQIAWRGKEPNECPDGPRYKALGNSMAVPVMRWIGERIEAMKEIER